MRNLKKYRIIAGETKSLRFFQNREILYALCVDSSVGSMFVYSSEDWLFVTVMMATLDHKPNYTFKTFQLFLVSAWFIQKQKNVKELPKADSTINYLYA